MCCWLFFFFVPHYFLYCLFLELLTLYVTFSFLMPGNLLYSNYSSDCSPPFVHILPHTKFRPLLSIHFNIIPLSTQWSSIGSISFRFPYQNLYAFPFTIIRAIFPAHPVLLDLSYDQLLVLLRTPAPRCC